MVGVAAEYGRRGGELVRIFGFRTSTYGVAAIDLCLFGSKSNSDITHKASPYEDNSAAVKSNKM